MAKICRHLGGNKVIIRANFRACSFSSRWPSAVNELWASSGKIESVSIFFCLLKLKQRFFTAVKRYDLRLSSIWSLSRLYQIVTNTSFTISTASEELWEDKWQNGPMKADAFYKKPQKNLHFAPNLYPTEVQNNIFFFKKSHNRAYSYQKLFLCILDHKIHSPKMI